MSSNVKLNTLLLKHHQHCQQRLVKALLITFAGLLLALVLYYFRERSIVLGGFALNFRHFSLVLLLPLAVLAAIEWRCYIRLKVTFREYTQVLVNLELAMLATKHEVARKKLLNAQANAKNNHLALAAIAERAPFIDSHIELLTKAALSEKLKVEMAAFRQECDAKLQTMKSQVPLIKAENKLRSLLAYIQARREQVTKQWEEAYDNSSWWNKLVNAGPVPGVSELDKAERDLKQMHSTLMIRHGKDLKRLETHFAKLKANTLLREGLK